MYSMQRQSPALFHFLFCELIEQCNKNSKDGEYESLKRVGAEIGFKVYTQICVKRGINERPQSIPQLLRVVQTKVFKHLFGYQAQNFQTYAPAQEEGRRIFQFGIIDEISIYLTLIPQKLWYTAILVGGIIEGILNHSGLKCTLKCHTKLEKDKPETHFQISIDQLDYANWRETP